MPDGSGDRKGRCGRHDRRKPVPPLLDILRGTLGDAGIPQRLRFTKNQWPYIRFRKTDGTEVSAQYRGARKDPVTKSVTPGKFIVFIPLPDGTQTRERFTTVDQVVEFAGVKKEDLERGRALRGGLTMEERAVSVIPQDEERSYLAKMRF